jgi:hypothetical protein
MLHAPEAQPCRLIALTSFGYANETQAIGQLKIGELRLDPYSWRETLLRTDYKDKGAGRAVSNEGRWRDARDGYDATP